MKKISLVIALVATATSQAETSGLRGRLRSGLKRLNPLQSHFDKQAAEAERVRREAEACRARPQPYERLSPLEDARFDQVQIMPDGPYRGCQVENSEERSIELVNDAQKLEILKQEVYDALTPTTWVFANFQTDGKFWIATFDTQRVQRMIMQEEALGLGVAHVQLRIEMQKDHCLQLYSQLSDRLGEKGPCVQNWVYSIEAGHHVGATKKYSAGGGMKGQYTIVYKAIALRDKAKYMLDQGHEVKQYLLDLDLDGIRSVGTQLFYQGTSRDRELVYHTLFKSCVTQAYALFDQLVTSRHPYSSLLTKSVRGLDSAPTLTRTYLNVRRLNAGKLPNLEEEFSSSSAIE